MSFDHFHVTTLLPSWLRCEELCVKTTSSTRMAPELRAILLAQVPDSPLLTAFRLVSLLTLI
jgi:hypothetical protein